MRLDGFGLLVNDMGTMVRFYRDVLGFEIREAEDTDNVYLEAASLGIVKEHDGPFDCYIDDGDELAAYFVQRVRNEKE